TSSPSRTRNDPNNLAHLSARINDIPRAPVSKRATCTRVISSASAKSSCRIFRLSRWLLRFKGTMNSSILSPPLCLQCNHQEGFCQDKVTQPCLLGELPRKPLASPHFFLPPPLSGREIFAHPIDGTTVPWYY